MDFLEKKYFYDKDMNKDEIVEISGDCYHQLYTIILNNNIEFEYDIYATLLENLSFYVRYSHGQLVRSSIKGNMNNIRDRYYHCDSITFKKDKDAAVRAINEYLDTHGYAIFRTVDQLLPCSIYFNESFKMDLSKFIEDGHVMLMIGKDSDYYYFIDQRSDLNLQKLKTPKNRIDIAMYEKEKFDELFGLFLSIKDFKYNKENLLKATEFGLEVIQLSVKDYFSNKVSNKYQFDGVDVVGGKKALLFLCDYCTNSNNSLKNKVYNSYAKEYSKFNVFKELSNGMTGIINARKVMLKYLETHYCQCISIIDILQNNCNKWKIFKNRLIKNYYDEKYNMGEHYKKYVNEISECEEQLFNKLKTEFC